MARDTLSTSALETVPSFIKARVIYLVAAGLMVEAGSCKKGLWVKERLLECNQRQATSLKLSIGFFLSV